MKTVDPPSLNDAIVALWTDMRLSLLLAIHGKNAFTYIHSENECVFMGSLALRAGWTPEQITSAFILWIKTQKEGVTLAS